jgi:hypothetical protein
MKKITLLAAAAVVSVAATAQNRTNISTNISTEMNHKVELKLQSGERAEGDTILYIPFQSFFPYVQADADAFDVQVYDVDGATLSASMTGGGWPSTLDYINIFDIPDTLNAPLDTNWSMAACSWHEDPTAQADNWLNFGPITIPAGGATVSWEHDMWDNGYRDGYEVLINNSGVEAYADFEPGVGVIYSVTDNDPTTDGDTVLTESVQTVSIPGSGSEQMIYMAFHHTGSDQFVVAFDNILVTEAIGSSVNNTSLNGVTLSQNVPNPAINNTKVDFSLVNNQEVNVNLFDITGKLVKGYNLGNLSAGNHSISFDTSDLSTGTYFYSLNNITRKMSVIK